MSGHHLALLQPQRSAGTTDASMSGGGGGLPPRTAHIRRLPPSLPGLLVHVEFTAQRHAIGTARHELDGALRGNSRLERVADDAVMAAQELMANAVLHGCRDCSPETEVSLTATCHGACLRLAVRDPSAEWTARSATDDLESGRGLDIVTELADRWGVKQCSSGGKEVWCELELEPQPSKEAQEPASQHRSLSTAERRVVMELADGKFLSDVAETMGIRYGEAREHLEAAAAKLGVRTVPDDPALIVAAAYQTQNLDRPAVANGAPQPTPVLPELVPLIVQGLLPEEMAEKTGHDISLVRQCCRKLKEDADARSRTHLIKRIYESGLWPPSDTTDTSGSHSPTAAEGQS